MPVKRNKLDAKVMRDARSGHSCIRCQRSDGTVCGRHYNGIRQHSYGKGRGIKGHALMVADFCNDCDARFQEGSIAKGDHLKRVDYSEEFQHWCIMSAIRRFDNGVFA